MIASIVSNPPPFAIFVHTSHALFVGGTVLYHNRPRGLHNHSGGSDDKENQRDVINAFVSTVLLGEGRSKNVLGDSSGDDGGPRREVITLGNQSSVVAEWLDGSGVDGEDETRKNWIALAVYPEVAIRKLRGVDALLSSLVRRYGLYYDHHCKQRLEDNGETEQQSALRNSNSQLVVPPPGEFDAAFHSMLRRFTDQLGSATATGSSNSISSLEKRHGNNSKSSSKQSSGGKKGKEKTIWHDGKQKVTKAALAELDMSKDAAGAAGEVGPDGIREDARAIAEAKAAYMPSADERPAWEEEDADVDDFDIAWNSPGDCKEGDGEEGDGSDQQSAASGVRGFFANLLSPNRPLTKADLDPPLKAMQSLLTSKNVAPSTASAICSVVEGQLLGKRVGTLVGVKRAVRHALEDAVEGILRPDVGRRTGGGPKRGGGVDVLRGVVEKRERGKGLLGGGGGGRPYVIVMIGINGASLGGACCCLRRFVRFLNSVRLLCLVSRPHERKGVGKSTSLAKIAYYLQSNQCSPLLAACDTFRSGAVEQLSVHASCLSLPLYHQGYAKDPSAVAKVS